MNDLLREKDELIRMSNDDTQREIYEMRAKTIRNKVSALNEAERKGIEKGMQKGIAEGEKNKAIEIEKSLLDVLDIETISLKTGLSIDEINKINI